MPQSIQVIAMDGTQQTIRFNKKQLARLAYQPEQNKLVLYLQNGSVFYIYGQEALAWYEKLTTTSQR